MSAQLAASKTVSTGSRGNAKRSKSKGRQRKPKSQVDTTARPSANNSKAQQSKENRGEGFVHTTHSASG